VAAAKRNRSIRRICPTRGENEVGRLEFNDTLAVGQRPHVHETDRISDLRSTFGFS
jgi:hypothetical protein